MGNQHATSLAWLAGLFDGEGSIQIRKDHRVRSGRFTPRVTLASTDPNIIERVQSIMMQLGVTPHVYEQDRAEYKKVCFHIQTNKRAHVRAFINAVLPYLVGKRARALMMLRFLDSLDKRDVSESEAVFTELKVANRRGGPSETTRETPRTGEDIVRAA